jgi:hypothetical protein
VQFAGRLLEALLRILALLLQIGDRLVEIVAPVADRLGGKGLVEVGRIAHPGAPLLDLHLLIEFILLALELGDHRFDFRHLPAMVFVAEPLKLQDRTL